MIARVIVDVPAKTVDRPFDYLVPKQLTEWIEVGCRVSVPFGRRFVQGFVIALVHESELAPEQMKSVDTVLDVEPVLTAELIQLSEWMSRKYACPRIFSLQATLPAALKTKLKRWITAEESEKSESVDSDPIAAQVISYIRENKKVEAKQLLEQFPNDAKKIKRLIAEGKLNEHKEIQDKVKIKTVLTVIPESEHLLRQALDVLSERAARQRELIQYFIDHPEPIPMKEIATNLQISPSTVRSLAQKNVLRIEEREQYRDPYEGRSFKKSEPLKLNEEQQAAYDAVAARLDAKRAGGYLLHGVTGSGKTEVYLQLIQRCIQSGRQSIVLVPEISLTPQMVERFKSRFGDKVAVLHSRLSHGERYDEWRKIREGAAEVAIGARSAIFAPFPKLGLIIIDEEHETSYKQDETPKYHAREVAFYRAKYHQAVVILGSATPSLETFNLAGKGIEHLILKSRVAGRPLPETEIVDMREELRAGNRSMFSRSLAAQIEQRLKRNEQIVLLLNRRGHSTFVMCRSCGFTAQCPHCDISLTYHRNSRNVRCHYCGYAEREYTICPDCGSDHIRFFGTGTQKVEEELVKLFPGIRVIRMDVDTTSEKGSHEKWLTAFRKRQADVLLGTQMVAKGLDFPFVTLVGVIAADTTLHLPDFRSSEKTFQLLTQVAGRAGRHELPGNVVIQTYNPEHYSIVEAGKHDYMGFVEKELPMRKQMMYPPFCELLAVTFSHPNLSSVIRASERFAAEFQDRWRRIQIDGEQTILDVFGPVASPIPRKKDRYRYQCMIKYRKKDLRVAMTARETAENVEKWLKSDALHISIDVNPQVML